MDHQQPDSYCPDIEGDELDTELNEEPTAGPGPCQEFRVSLVIPVAILALIAAACADDSSNPISPAPTAAATTSTPAATSTPAPTTNTTTTTQLPATATATAPTEVTVTGVVIAVEGNLTGIDSFVIRLPDGTDLILAPTEGLLFDGVAPLSHLRDHLVSGNPIHVIYQPSSAIPPIATAIGDAAGETHSED